MPRRKFTIHVSESFMTMNVIILLRPIDPSLKLDFSLNHTLVNVFCGSKSCYDVLSIQRNASSKEVKKV